MLLHFISQKNVGVAVWTRLVRRKEHDIVLYLTLLLTLERYGA